MSFFTKASGKSSDLSQRSLLRMIIIQMISFITGKGSMTWTTQQRQVFFVVKAFVVANVVNVRSRAATDPALAIVSLPDSLFRDQPRVSVVGG